MKHKRNQRGFHHIALVLTIVVVAVIGLVGWRVLNKQDKSQPSSATPTQPIIDPSKQPANSIYWDMTYVSLSDRPDKFSPGSKAVEHASVPDVIQLIKALGKYAAGDILIYYVDSAHMSGPGTENIGLVVSKDNGKTWSSGISTRVSGKVNKGGVVDPSVVQLLDGRLRMYFFGSEVTNGDPAQQTQPHRVYSAISANGVNFTVESGIRFEESSKLTDPEVIFWSNQWYMYYSMITETQLAVSSDGLNFTAKKVIGGSVGGVPGALAFDNGVRIYGCSQGIATAFANDGLNFKTDGTDIVAGALCDPSAIKLADGQYLMIYKVKDPPAYAN